MVLAALLIRHYVFMLTIVSGSSMEETLHDHQIVAVDRLRYALADPQRGDIVICHYPNDSKNYVKRIVAIAGDWLQNPGRRHLPQRPSLAGGVHRLQGLQRLWPLPGAGGLRIRHGR